MKRLRRAAGLFSSQIQTRFRAGFTLLGRIDPVDVLTFAGLGDIYIGFHRDDMPLVVVGALIAMVGIRGARARELMARDLTQRRER